MIVLYGVAFLSGLLTILAPCIWPLLPIILADVTKAKSRKRPLGITVGGAIGIIILSNILDAISGLGSIRNWLPTHYSFSWFDALSSSIDWSQMIRGASYSVILSAFFVSLAIIKFNKKDITS